MCTERPGLPEFSRKDFTRDQRGSAAVEYGIAASVFAGLALFTINLFDAEIRQIADTVLQALAQVQ
jgi:Flp pilus assembly protein TadG